MHFKTEMVLKSVEIAIVVEEGVTSFDAKCCDEAIDHVADRDAHPPERPEIAGRSNCDCAASCFKDGELVQGIEYRHELLLAPDTLQDFAHDESGDAEATGSEILAQPVSLRSRTLGQEINQD